MQLLVLLIIAGICGAIGQTIAGSYRGGILAAIALGFIGAILGGYIARQAGLPDIFVLHVGNVNLPIIWSIIGSALFVAVLGLLSRR
jgi:uncharacterized membrane protein YeaQ/YmgE (transglycosylase-associated protein family)